MLYRTDVRALYQVKFTIMLWESIFIPFHRYGKKRLREVK